MPRFRDRSIKQKLRWGILLTSGLGLFLACAAFIANDLISLRRTMTREVTLLADVLGNNSTAALSFDAPASAEDILKALKAQPNIVAARLYDQDGRVFATYSRGDPPVHVPAEPAADGARFTSDRLVVVRPVMLEDKRIGTLYLHADVLAKTARIKFYATVVPLVLGLVLLVMLGLAVRLEEVISKPIVALANTARAVAERKDYSVRAEKYTHDELGVLTDAFNEMLTQIQQRTAELQQARDELEARVQQRTAELATVNAELRQSEERTRLILDRANEAFVAIDAGGRIIHWNPEAEATFGWSRAEALNRILAETIIPPQHRAAHTRGMQHFLATGQGPVLNHRVELTALHRDGREFPVELTISPIKLGDAYIFSAFIHDITDRKRAEQDLQHAADELARSNAELEQFAYVASHDLQEPLRMVSSYLQLLQRRAGDKLDSTATEFIGYAVDGAQRMRTLIKDLLEFSRVGRKGRPFEPVDCTTVVQTVLANLQPAISDYNARVTHGPLPVVQGDAGELTQLFQNLVGNALKFHGPQPPEVAVAASARNGGWEFSVRDNGIGIEPQYLDRIFIIFQRLHSRAKYQGTGIGLAICKKIVEHHGGRIWVESAPGRGSSFNFTIPKEAPPS